MPLVPGAHEEGLTAKEAMHTWLFWVCGISMMVSALFWTGVNIYSVSIFRSRGFQDTDVGLAFAIVSGVSLASSAVGGIALDYLKHKQLIFVAASTFNAITNILLLRMKSKADVIAFAICYGTYVGMSNAGWLGKDPALSSNTIVISILTLAQGGFVSPSCAPHQALQQPLHACCFQTSYAPPHARGCHTAISVTYT